MLYTEIFPNIRRHNVEKNKFIKRKKRLVEKSTQCNILESYVKDLEKLLDILKE